MKFAKEIVPYIVVVICVLTIKQLIVTPIKVNGSSMNDTLYDGDIMLLDEISYRFSDIKRFDIVVAKYSNEYLIKRVIGLPGEKIEYKDNVLYINGEKVEDPYPSTATDDFSIEDIGHVKVPGDTYFVMGDNRSDSLDSRYPQVGVINKTQILGRAKFVIWPINRFIFSSKGGKYEKIYC